MKPFEVFYSLLFPFLPPLYGHVHYLLASFVRDFDQQLKGRPQILDVGGRKSHYTIGIAGDVTISEIPRQTEIQQSLNLGINDSIMQQTLARRSNVKSIVYDNMVKTRLSSNYYDIVVAVEVLEHVEEDAQFVKNVAGRLRPGGYFIATTPNGDYLTRVTNPDHKRHYGRNQLSDLLKRHFGTVHVYYYVKGGQFQNWGLRSWSARKPLVTLQSMVGNLINCYESSRPDVVTSCVGTHHLVVIAKK